jgi:hypothetical protein
LVLARRPLPPTAPAARADRALVTGTYGLEQGPDGPFRWTRGRAHLYLPAEQPYLVMRLSVAHPDSATNPVRLTVSSRCETLLDVQLTSAQPITLGLELPEGERVADIAVEVSRTWRPAAFGTDDPRRLGAAMAAEFTGSGERFREQQQKRVLSRCLL